MADYYIKLPSAVTWRTPVADAAALPTVGNRDGDARVTLNDQSIYVWKESTSSWIQAATPAVTSAITALNTDVSAVGPGAVVATVNSVGGSTAANINAATILANAATAANTASTIVRRDASGNFAAGTITAALTGTASGNPPNSRLINTTAPLLGGGDLSADRTLSITESTTLVDGYLSAANFLIFNDKASTDFVTAADLQNNALFNYYNFI